MTRKWAVWVHLRCEYLGNCLCARVSDHPANLRCEGVSQGQLRQSIAHAERNCLTGMAASIVPLAQTHVNAIEFLVQGG